MGPSFGNVKYVLQATNQDTVGLRKDLCSSDYGGEGEQSEITKV